MKVGVIILLQRDKMWEISSRAPLQSTKETRNPNGSAGVPACVDELLLHRQGRPRHHFSDFGFRIWLWPRAALGLAIQLFASLAMSLLPAIPVAAGSPPGPLVIYVAPQPMGKDGASGTREEPWASVNAAL